MSSPERLYNLLPAIHRIRDADHGEPLRAWLAVIEGELQLLEEDISRLYDNWFIETCDEWVVPYLGDLLGVGGLLPRQKGAFSQRGLVANTLGYRRRKGTAAMLEQLAREVTGWPAKVVEFFELLAATQYVNHVRADKSGTVNLRDTNRLDLLNSPFDRTAHTAEVRPIDNGRGKYNIPNVGLFLWRLQSYAILSATPRAVSDPPDGRYSFTSLGYDAPLFTRPKTEKDITHLAEEVNVPRVIRPAAFFFDLKQYQETAPKDQPSESTYYGPNRSLHIIKGGTLVSPMDVVCKDLRHWDRPLTGKVAVDVRLGRLAFALGEGPKEGVLVSYNYGFSGDISGGPYDRRRRANGSEKPEFDTIAEPGALDVLIQVPSPGIDTISDALEIWNPAIHPRAVIRIRDNRTYQENLAITIAGAELIIQAANNQRPTLIGEVIVSGGAGEARLELNGLLISGSLHVVGNLGALSIAHCTLVPGRRLNLERQPQEPGQPSLIVEPANTRLKVEINHSIIGPLRLPSEIDSLEVRDSIIDSPARDRPAIAATDAGDQPGPPTTLKRTTIFGTVHVKELNLASETIFTERVTADRRQAGCVRFSYVPDGSQTPRRYRCQPDLAMQKALEAANPSLTSEEQQGIASGTRLRLTPAFTSRRYGEPGYAQLSLSCAEEFRTVAEDENEMGAFNFLQQAQRAKNLLASLDEYLRFGLEAGVFFVT